MAKKRKVGNLLALAVLGYLGRQPAHPYELSRTLREHGDDRSIKFNHGSLYMVFQQLTKAGFVTELETSRDGQRPERTVYRLTDEGRAELDDWLQELVEEPEFEYPQFVAALSMIAVLPPSAAVELLRRRLGHLSELRGEEQRLLDKLHRDGIAGLFLVEEDFRLARLDADIAFVRGLIDKILDPDGWGRTWADYHGEAPPR
jgi:DNA-binding PadR family transcriptional regulator